MKPIAKTIIEREIKINDIHCARIEEALERLKHILPASDSKIKNISFEDMSAFTVLVDRFGKLQDSIGEKVFKNVLVILQENITNTTPMRDVLSVLAKLQIIESVDYWIKFRKMRNQFTHEYSDDLEITAKNINEAALYSRELCDYWQELKRDHLTNI